VTLLKGKVDPVEHYIAREEAKSGAEKKAQVIDIEHENFQWLMEHLLPPNPAKFKGCELIFPDTAFFEGGNCK